MFRRGWDRHPSRGECTIWCAASARRRGRPVNQTSWTARCPQCRRRKGSAFLGAMAEENRVRQWRTWDRFRSVVQNKLGTVDQRPEAAGIGRAGIVVLGDILAHRTLLLGSRKARENRQIERLDH